MKYIAYVLVLAGVMLMLISCGGGEDGRKQIPEPVDRAHALSASSPQR